MKFQTYKGFFKSKYKLLKDSDGDGVPDQYDCQPYNKRKQEPKYQTDSFKVNGSHIANMVNPAGVWATQQGFKVNIVEGPGGQSGMITLPNGQQVDEWTYMRSNPPPSGWSPIAAARKLREQQSTGTPVQYSLGKNIPENLKEQFKSNITNLIQNHQSLNAKHWSIMQSLGMYPKNYIQGPDGLYHYVQNKSPRPRPR